MLSLVILACFSLAGVQGQMRSTFPPWGHTGEECLPYDGSKVPDCRLFVDPATKQPYYHPHNTNCSRFWECGPENEICLFECAPCGKDENPDLCKGQWALSFDYNIQFPDGPVCNWPSIIDCDNTPGECDCLDWQTCVNGKCIPQCQEDNHCPNGYECDDCGWCVPLSGCQADQDCKYELCDPPKNPHTTCEYCNVESGDCRPGCADDSQCPDNYPICGHGGGVHLCGCDNDIDCNEDQICDQDSHQCIPKPVGCDNQDSNCLQDICDVENNPYTTCEWCDGLQCKPGCSDDQWCPQNRPICGAQGQPHLCGCNTDDDCQAGKICSNNECIDPECTKDEDCKNGECDTENTPDYLDCEYCDNNNCVPGCRSGEYCPSGYQCSAHICSANIGKTLLKSVKITSRSCSGCSSEGLKLILNGRLNVASPIQCKTNNLDHTGETDFDAGDAVFDDKLTLGLFENGGGCLNAPLDGDISDSRWEWKGEGTWTGETICVEWQEGDVFAAICDFETNGAITGCHTHTGVACP